MKYEELLCDLFECSQDGDPLGLASADTYMGNIIKIEEGKGIELRVGVYSALRKLFLMTDPLYPPDKEHLRSFYDRHDEFVDLIFTTKSQQDIDSMIRMIREEFNVFTEVKKGALA